MARTYRYTHPGWGPGNDEFDERFPDIKSKKHQIMKQSKKPVFRKYFTKFYGKEKMTIGLNSDRHTVQERFERERFTEEN